MHAGSRTSVRYVAVLDDGSSGTIGSHNAVAPSAAEVRAAVAARGRVGADLDIPVGPRSNGSQCNAHVGLLRAPKPRARQALTYLPKENNRQQAPPIRSDSNGEYTYWYVLPPPPH